MFHTISERIIAYAVKNNTLDKDKTEEYIYGLEISLSVFVSYISVLIIGFFMEMFWQSALFLFIFVTVRRFAGGFHFSSQIACFLSMWVICSTVLLIIKYSNNSVILYSVIMAISTIVLLILSPLPAIEKPLDAKERIVYGRIARIIILVVAVTYTAFCLFQNMYVAKIIAVTICAVAILAILGKVKFKMYEKTV